MMNASASPPGAVSANCNAALMSFAISTSGNGVLKPACLVTTMDVRPGNGRPIDSHVRRPMTMG
jgi:hypothetical protein